MKKIRTLKLGKMLLVLIKKGVILIKRKGKEGEKSTHFTFFSELVQFNEIFRKIINELNVNNY